jgi:DNA-binding NtrC family response regulator
MQHDFATPDPEQYAGVTVGPAQSFHLLLVDDEELLVRSLGMLLERAGFRITAFSAPADAIAALRGYPGTFDAVLCDVRMPRHSGFDVAREAHLARPDLAVLMMSGAPFSDEMSADAQRCGVSDVLLKPVRMDTLRMALMNALTAHAA